MNYDSQQVVGPPHEARLARNNVGGVDVAVGASEVQGMACAQSEVCELDGEAAWMLLWSFPLLVRRLHPAMWFTIRSWCLVLLVHHHSPRVMM